MCLQANSIAKQHSQYTQGPVCDKYRSCTAETPVQQCVVVAVVAVDVVVVAVVVAVVAAVVLTSYKGRSFVD